MYENFKFRFDFDGESVQNVRVFYDNKEISDKDIEVHGIMQHLKAIAGQLVMTNPKDLKTKTKIVSDDELKELGFDD